MKKLLTILILIAITAPLALLPSCGSDDPAPKILVVAERTTGKLFSVNKSTAARTEIGTVTLNDVALQQLRGMVYNSSNKTLYASSTTDGDGALYSIDPETLEATVFNSDVDDAWYGVANLLVTEDNEILATLWRRDPTESGLSTFNLAGEIGPRVSFTDELCCGMGMVFGDDKTEVIVASEDLELYTSDMEGTTTLLTTLVPEGFGVTIVDDLFIQNMVKADGKIYAIVYDQELLDTHLAVIDLEEETVTSIGKLNVGNTNRYHALMLISKDAL